MQRSALCRSRRELSNEYLLAKIGVDRAENEPLEVWGKIIQYYSFVSLGTMKKGGDEMRIAFDEMAGGKNEVTPEDVGAFFSKLGFRKDFYADLLPEKNLSYQEWLSYYESTFFSKGLSRQPFHRGGPKALPEQRAPHSLAGS